MRGLNLLPMEPRGRVSARAIAGWGLAVLLVACGARTGFDEPIVERLGPGGSGLGADAGDAAGLREGDGGAGGADAATLGDAGDAAGADAGPDATGCGPQNCSGCCSEGVCKPGFAPEACGGGGIACVLCGPELACSTANRTCK